MNSLPLRAFILVASLALLSSLAPAQKRTTVPAVTKMSTGEAGVHQWIDDFTKAFDARDTQAIMQLYTPDVVAYDIVPPLQYVGKPAYTKDFADFFAQYKGPLSIEYRDLHIYTSGEFAMVMCLEHVSGTLTNGQQSSFWLRDTTGLRRVNGRWLDFHDHVSVPTDFATGQSQLKLIP